MSVNASGVSFHSSVTCTSLQYMFSSSVLATTTEAAASVASVLQATDATATHSVFSAAMLTSVCQQNIWPHPASPITIL